jgi:hypothetical protein
MYCKWNFSHLKNMVFVLCNISRLLVQSGKNGNPDNITKIVTVTDR